MKIVNLMVALSLSLSLTAAVPNVDDSVLAAFTNTYPSAQQVQWTKVGSNWEAYFKENGIINRLQYRHNGELVHVTRHYGGVHLNPYLLAKIQRKYRERSIFGVTEITTEDQLCYYIVLEDAQHWYHVEANALGELQLTKKYRKA